MLRKAAEQGYPDAQLDLGFYMCPDDEAGLKWIEKAARQGLTEAQRALGDYYSTDLCGSPNLGAAARWYEAAANQGDKEAEKLLHQTETELTALALTRRGDARQSEGLYASAIDLHRKALVLELCPKVGDGDFRRRVGLA